jgi:hypothetical protein
MLEELDLSLAALSLFQRREGAEIAAPARARIQLERVEPVATIGQPTDHADV